MRMQATTVLKSGSCTEKPKSWDDFFDSTLCISNDFKMDREKNDFFKQQG